jgi:hypothetical protein
MIILRGYQAGNSERCTASAERALFRDHIGMPLGEGVYGRCVRHIRGACVSTR